jgi:HPt (histidine-containing phosphotransfer) domain-containing protein
MEICVSAALDYRRRDCASAGTPLPPQPPADPSCEILVLDETRLDELAATLPLVSIEEFLEMYFADVEFQLLEIAGARAKSDFEAIRKLAHGLVGTAGNFGALRVSAAARHLETLCRNADCRDSYAAIGRLSRACDAAEEAMRAWLTAHRRTLLAGAS